MFSRWGNSTLTDRTLITGMPAISISMPFRDYATLREVWSREQRLCRRNRISNWLFHDAPGRQHPGQSHMEFTVVEGWLHLLGEWRCQLGSRVPERRGTRVSAFLCS